MKIAYMYPDERAGGVDERGRMIASRAHAVADGFRLVDLKIVGRDPSKPKWVRLSNGQSMQSSMAATYGFDVSPAELQAVDDKAIVAKALAAPPVRTVATGATSDPAAGLRSAILSLPEARRCPQAARQLADSALSRRLTLAQAQGLLRGLPPEPAVESARPLDARTTRVAELRKLGHRPAL